MGQSVHKKDEENDIFIVFLQYTYIVQHNDIRFIRIVLRLRGWRAFRR
jgi:hypothetical protein